MFPVLPIGSWSPGDPLGPGGPGIPLGPSLPGNPSPFRGPRKRCLQYRHHPRAFATAIATPTKAPIEAVWLC